MKVINIVRNYLQFTYTCNSKMFYSGESTTVDTRVLGPIPSNTPCTCTTPPDLNSAIQRVNHLRQDPISVTGWTHLPWTKMAAISLTVYSNIFLWMKSFVFWLNFRWSFVLKGLIDNSPPLVEIINGLKPNRRIYAALRGDEDDLMVSYMKVIDIV